jgi:peroxiredoxin Q/BCP
MSMVVWRRRRLGALLSGAALAIAATVFGSGPAVAVEAGQPAPDFKLPGSMGADVALGDFRGKKWVLLEFYGADFAPT